MYGKKPRMWCCALLLVISFAESQNFKNEENDELNANFTTHYSDQTEKLRRDSYKNPFKNTQYEDCRINSTCNDDENLTRIEEENDQLLKNSSSTLEIFTVTAPNSNLSVEMNKINYIDLGADIGSLLFLLPIFLVYSILPELRNVHGFILRNYIGALSIAYGIDIVNIIIRTNAVQDSVCITIAFLIYFCFLASFFWLNIMSFDIWWTFRTFYSLQRNVKQQQRKKLLFYAIYAWGIPFILAIVCSIMDFITSVPEIFQPKFRTSGCILDGENIIAFILYYYVLKSMCIISSICLSISTALKIGRYKKDTSHCLIDSESKCYNDNKKWFNLYLKLFIVLFIVIGIKWLMITASLLYENVSIYNSCATNLLDIIKNLCTFIIFLWKKRIKRMLFKRFGFDLSSNA
ncbi:G-protein coupled receptor Mth2-like [Nylanderia fulva]|uniref:G-protein coupled receptor Mth2-like n=1 Tax=Nylanderia fulva TaxID=613905 RepID=UPI0010FB836D|nr:G-protein coupled receptor Mth2-like [Nylanderia fulva]XP_029177761.1 G-protein coupled receptor Mth2-like [Nylanderia fulva]